MTSLSSSYFCYGWRCCLLLEALLNLFKIHSRMQFATVLVPVLLVLASVLVDALHYDICQYKEAAITCAGDTVIHVMKANFGRTDRDICPDPLHAHNTHCHSHHSLAIVKRLCDGKHHCHVHVDNEDLGGNPCPGTYKYLHLEVHCDHHH
ncbi:L-rhamnose-binding lectin ELEL-1-like [Lineus longissimus]|uniref:L-rhamnose-binding lectin ELEL-1-like n=1 Tax=Lineus longissimus TaxID=88925 RepID=UPI00315D41FE